jgi:hypothetical protein
MYPVPKFLFTVQYVFNDVCTVILHTLNVFYLPFSSLEISWPFCSGKITLICLFANTGKVKWPQWPLI